MLIVSSSADLCSLIGRFAVDGIQAEALREISR